MKIYLYPNLDKTHCFEYTTATYERLRKNGAKLFMDRCYKHVFGKLDITFCSEDECVKQCDMIIAIGGDGTILKCSLKGCEFEKPILGINCGRLGFMASLEHSQLELLDIYTTPGYFSRLYKKYKGVSPEAERRGSKS